MLKPYYILNEPNGDKPTYIYLLCLCADGRLKYSLAEKVEPKNWNGSLTNKKSNVNIKIGRINQMVEELNLKQAIDGLPITKTELKNKVNYILGKAFETKSTFSFFLMVEKIIDERAAGKELQGGKRFSAGTITNYKGTLKILQQFEQFSKKPFDVSAFSMEDYRAYFAFLTTEKQYSINTVGRHLKVLKALIKASFQRGWHQNNIFLNQDFKVPNEITSKVYLTVAELDKINNLPLLATFASSRDWFLVEAFTGLRVSDLLRLKMVNVKDGTIMISNEKTDSVVIVPLHRIIKEVMQRNDGLLPPLISEQKINTYIKAVCQMAGFNELVLTTSTVGGSRVDSYIEKWQLITNHTGRRSFITNLLKQNINDSIVMQLAGIRGVNTLKRYNKMNASETATVAAALDFFK